MTDALSARIIFRVLIVAFLDLLFVEIMHRAPSSGGRGRCALCTAPAAAKAVSTGSVLRELAPERQYAGGAPLFNSNVHHGASFVRRERVSERKLTAEPMIVYWYKHVTIRVP